MVDKESCKLLEYNESLMNSDVYQFYLNLVKRHNQDEIRENIWPKLTGDTLYGFEKIDYRGNCMFAVDKKFVGSKEDIEIENGDSNCSYTFFHLGSKLTGHEGIVHGGLLATLLDELTCRLAFLSLPSHMGVTANLNINYKKPCPLDSYILVKCELLYKKGRKCLVRGNIYKVNLDSISAVESDENLLTSGDVLIIEPNWANKLQHN